MLRSATIGEHAFNSSWHYGSNDPGIIATNRAFDELWENTGKRCFSCAVSITKRGRDGTCTRAHVPPHSYSKKQPWRFTTPEFTTVFPWCRKCDEAAADKTDCPQIRNTYANISKMSEGVSLARLENYKSNRDIRNHVRKTLTKKELRKLSINSGRTRRKRRKHKRRGTPATKSP